MYYVREQTVSIFELDRLLKASELGVWRIEIQIHFHFCRECHIIIH